MKKLFSFLLVLSLCFILTLFVFATRTIAATQINYPNQSLSGGFQSGNFEDIWDLTACDLTLSFTYDGNGLSDIAEAHAWSEFGIRQVGASNFNPTIGSGVWLATDYDWTVGTFNPDPVDAPTLDLDDKFILQRQGGQGEGVYNLPSVPSAPGNNHRFWWDRDGVDPWQNDETANTDGFYNILIDLSANSSTTGEAYMKINSLDQGFETDGNWSTIEITPAGMTFTGDMTQMQVFYGLYGYGTTHSVAFNDIQVTGCRSAVEPDKVTGGSEKLIAGGTNFGLAVNAVHAGKNGDKLNGKIEYSRDNLKFHAAIQCVKATPDGMIATVAGPVTKEQYDPENVINKETSDWAYVAIKEGGTGSGDRVRVLLLSETEALEKCSNPDGETSFPGIVEVGEFKIRL